MTKVASYEYHTFWDDVEEEIIVYCIYRYAPEQATVVFDYNGGFFGPEDYDKVVFHGEPLSTYFVSNPTRPGYTFLKWFDITDKPPIDLVPTVPPEPANSHKGNFGGAGSVTVYIAQWTINEYTVIFEEGDHGSFTTTDDPLAEQTVEHNDTVKDVPKITSDDGWKFICWEARKIDGDEIVGRYDDLAVLNHPIFYNVKFVAQYVEIVTAGDNYATVKVIGKQNDTDGAKLFEIIFWVSVDDKDFEEYNGITINNLPILAPTWKLMSDQADKLKDIDLSETDTIELYYESGVTTVTVKAVYDDGLYSTQIPGFAQFEVPAEIGKPITIPPPSIIGYNHTGENPAGGYIASVTTGLTVIFYYKKASGNVTVIAIEGTTEIGRYTTTAATGTSTAVGTFVPTTTEIPALAYYTRTNTGDNTTHSTYDGVHDVTITYYYTKNTATLTLKAYSTLTGNQIGSISITTATQRVLENYNYIGDIAALTAAVNSAHPGSYTLLAQGNTYYYISPTSANNIAEVWYKPAQSGEIPVEVRIGSTSGILIQTYSIKVAPGDSVTFSGNMIPDLSALGYTINLVSSILSATQGHATNNKIILVYNDNRHTVTVKTTVDDGVNTNTVATIKLVDGDSVTLLPPYIAVGQS